MGASQQCEDVQAIYRAYKIEDQKYIEVVEQRRYRQIKQRWPLLAELHATASIATPSPISSAR
ncbi:MAG: BcsR/BcsP family cellulose biosynthesis protein [Zhongshania sp.]|uniref:BcsR/BcsP family cellulose biosynthesis protein n=1 Tax=Zhongshania sp. TaxID=1971902 RepID=UPI002629462A|nr:BcsR/BcsP family cellulose biosynthesis protein [Zhongshania sp.]MDF1693787.1 BcsR/BcsP family cellulose biosynthesis protein [Zhongshania sp.]